MEFFDRCAEILKEEDEKLNYETVHFLRAERNSLQSSFNVNAKLNVCATDDEIRALIKNAISIVYDKDKTYEILKEGTGYNMQKIVGVFRLIYTYNSTNMSSYISIDVMGGVK